jgi:hypothetical protein
MKVKILPVPKPAGCLKKSLHPKLEVTSLTRGATAVVAPRVRLHFPTTFRIPEQCSGAKLP